MAHSLPAELYSWLAETGSLTKRLRGIYGDQFGVKVLYQQWKPVFADEAGLLALPYARNQLVREVMLTRGEQPLILARSILPAQTIKVARRNLSHLGVRPLGEVIFAYPDLELRRRQYCHAGPAIWSAPLKEQSGAMQAVWGRRTVYAIHNQPLLVAEFFLPALAADGGWA
ncbi:MAG: chorismate lyase [Methylomonas sp.]|jgi:chorismate--pyruvate lyase